MESVNTVALVSGANQGIGYETVKKLATEQPTYHVLLGSRDISKGQDAKKSMGNLPNVEPIQLDIASDESIALATQYVSKTFGRLDVLVNNAGVAGRGMPNGSTPREIYEHILSVNVVSTSLLTDAFVPLLKQSSHPRILFVSSELGSIGESLDPKSPFYAYQDPAYKSSKAALNMLAVSYSQKYLKDGFKVNSTCPGFNKTAMNDYGGIGEPKDGAINAVRLVTQGKDGQTATFSRRQGTIPW